MVAVANKIGIGAGIGIALLLLARSGSKRGGSATGGATRGATGAVEVPTAHSSGQQDLRYYLTQAGLAPEWVIFFEAVAANESGFNNLRGLGRPSMFPAWASPNVKASTRVQEREREAALIAYTRNAGLYSRCEFSADEYSFGSGGWFGMLPANGLIAFRGTSLECINPAYVFSPGASVVMAIEMARRLMGWKRWKKVPTFGNLRVGWGNPASMGKPKSLSRMRAKLSERYLQIGADPSLIGSKPPPLPSRNPVGMFDRLTNL